MRRSNSRSIMRRLSNVLRGRRGRCSTLRISTRRKMARSNNISTFHSGRYIEEQGSFPLSKQERTMKSGGRRDNRTKHNDSINNATKIYSLIVNDSIKEVTSTLST